MSFMGQFLSKRTRVCDNCFVKSLTKMTDLFTFMDCDGNGLIDVKDLIKLFNNLDEEKKLPFKVTNTMANAFFLNGMEVDTASMNVVDFKYACVMGFIERNIVKNNFEVDVLKLLKGVRLENIKLGTGPT